MRQHNIWCVYVRSVWRGMADGIPSSVLTTCNITQHNRAAAFRQMKVSFDLLLKKWMMPWSSAWTLYQPVIWRHVVSVILKAVCPAGLMLRAWPTERTITATRNVWGTTATIQFLILLDTIYDSVLLRYYYVSIGDPTVHLTTL